MAIINKILSYINIISKSLGFLGTFPYAGSACYASLLINIGLTFLHTDCLYRTTSQASIAIPAPGCKGKNYRFIFFSDIFCNLFFEKTGFSVYNFLNHLRGTSLYHFIADLDSRASITPLETERCTYIHKIV